MCSAPGRKMERSLSIAFALSCLLSATSAGFSSAYSSHAGQGQASVQHVQPLPQPTDINSWTWTPYQEAPQRDSYSYPPPLPPQVHAPARPQLQVQQPQPQQFHVQTQTQPRIPQGTLQLLPLPTHSNPNGQNSFFYSPHDKVVYKVTKITLNDQKPNPEQGYGPPKPPTTATTTTTPRPSTIAIDYDPLPPTPPLPTVLAITRDPSRRPYFRIRLRAYDNIGPGLGCSGGGEGRNPELTPIFGEEPGCPPAPPVTGSPQFGVPEPLSFQQPNSSEASPNLKLPPLPGHKDSRPPASTYYAAPSSEYGAPPLSALQDENGQAGTGRTGATQAQATGSTGIDLDIGGGFK